MDVGEVRLQILAHFRVTVREQNRVQLLVGRCFLKRSCNAVCLRYNDYLADGIARTPQARRDLTLASAFCRQPQDLCVVHHIGVPPVLCSRTFVRQLHYIIPCFGLWLTSPFWVALFLRASGLMEVVFTTSWMPG